MRSGPTIVLIIDEDDDALALYARGLRGFQSVTANNADEGFAYACACDPAVIIVDLMMSARSCFELMRRLRQDTRTRDVPIIALTGLTLPATRQRAREVGCDRFLLKTFVPEALAAEIRDVLRNAGETSLRPSIPRVW